MKTMKYRMMFSAFMCIALSVFLFTSCEKKSDGVPAKVDRISKFKSLTFTGQTASTTANSGNGTFTGNGNNISYTPPTQDPPTFSPSAAEGKPFTDPTSSGNSFGVVGGFSLGGGTVTLDGKSYEIDFGFCANSDLFGKAPKPGGQGGPTNKDDLNVFIGIAGNFDVDDFDEADTLSNPLNLLLYVFSYNGASNLGNYDNFENGNVENSAFVIAIEFDDSINSLNAYFSTAGTVDFSGENVTLSGVKMSKVIEDTQFNHLDNNSVGLQAFLECGGISFDLDD